MSYWKLSKWSSLAFKIELKHTSEPEAISVWLRLGEIQADSFAIRMLLSEKERNEIIKYPTFNKELILTLSEKLRKHPGIIVAQLQRQGVVQYNNVQLKNLKEKVVFSNLAL